MMDTDFLQRAIGCPTRTGGRIACQQNGLTRIYIGVRDDNKQKSYIFLFIVELFSPVLFASIFTKNHTQSVFIPYKYIDVSDREYDLAFFILYSEEEKKKCI